MERDPPEGCSAAPIDESDLYVWNASVVGPEQSPWEGGLFTLKLSTCVYMIFFLRKLFICSFFFARFLVVVFLCC